MHDAVAWAVYDAASLTQVGWSTVCDNAVTVGVWNAVLDAVLVTPDWAVWDAVEAAVRLIGVGRLSSES